MLSFAQHLGQCLGIGFDKHIECLTYIHSNSKIHAPVAGTEEIEHLATAVSQATLAYLFSDPSSERRRQGSL